MGLRDRIQDEMYVNTESLLEEEFERTQKFFDIYEDNTVVLTEGLTNVGSEEQILIHLIAWQYIAEANGDETSGLSYDYFYERIDAGDSTIRGYFSNFVDEGIVRENEEGNRELVVERLGEVISKIESEIGEKDD